MFIVQIMKDNTSMEEQTWRQLKYSWNFYFLNKLIAPNAKFSNWKHYVVEIWFLNLSMPTSLP